jgi:hypothetical protein
VWKAPKNIPKHSSEAIVSAKSLQWLNSFGLKQFDRRVFVCLHEYANHKNDDKKKKVFKQSVPLA